MRNLEIKNINCYAALAMTNNMQSGRSMIEMLGVLAIIGVLSVGGIAGYSKAMMKYRINKTISLITETSQGVRSFFAPQRSYAGVGNKDVQTKAKLMPDYVDCESGFCYTPFGSDTEYLIYEENEGKNFSVLVWNIPSEACLELATQNWNEVASGSYAIVVGANNDMDVADYLHDGGKIDNNCSGKVFDNGMIACSKGADISMPLGIDMAANICGNCKDNCSIQLYFT